MIEPNSTQTYANDANVKEISSLLNDEPQKTIEPGEKKADDNIQTKPAQVSNETPDAVAPQTQSESSDPQTDDNEAPQIDENENEVEHVTLKDLAHTLDVDTKDLYDVEIPIGADKVVKLGDLKDSFKKFEVMQQGQDEFEQNKTRSENEMMIARRQIDSLVALGTKAGVLTPQIIDLVDKQHDQTVNRERNALYNILPEWKDNTTRANDFDAIAGMLGDYGFSRSEIEGVLDHRLLKFAHDMAKRTNMIKQAKQKKPVPKNTGKHSRSISPNKSTLQKRITQAKSGSQSQKIDAISSLIN